MAVDTEHSYNLAVDDEDYLVRFIEADEDDEEDENYQEEEDSYDFPKTDSDGPWYDPQEAE